MMMPYCSDGGACFARDRKGFCKVLNHSYEDEDRPCPFKKSDYEFKKGAKGYEEYQGNR